MMRSRAMRAAVAAAAVSAALAPAADAHVTVNPPESEAESFSRFAIRVPTERPDASTTKVTVRIPEGVFFVSFQPKPGWKRTVKMAKLDQPVDLFGDEVTERVDTVTWSGGTIRPGEFDEFGMSARMPEEAGKELVFPAVQTYSSGEVVRWIGPPDTEQPAPRVKLTPVAEEQQAAANSPAASPAPASSGGDDSSDTLAIVALVAGIAGLVAGLAGLAASRRKKAIA